MYSVAAVAASIVSYNTWSALRRLFTADPHSSVNENTRGERERERERERRRASANIMAALPCAAVAAAAARLNSSSGIVFAIEDSREG